MEARVHLYKRFAHCYGVLHCFYFLVIVYQGFYYFCTITFGLSVNVFLVVQNKMLFFYVATVHFKEINSF